VVPHTNGLFYSPTRLSRLTQPPLTPCHHPEANRGSTALSGPRTPIAKEKPQWQGEAGDAAAATVVTALEMLCALAAAGVPHDRLDGRGRT
jgi:hypothetical protein